MGSSASSDLRFPAKHSGIGSDIVHAVLLAHVADPQSAFFHKAFPRDVVRLLLRQFLPSARGYLIPRPLARSYYQICRDKCPETPQQRVRRLPFGLSTTAYAAFPGNRGSEDLLHVAGRVIAFLRRVRAEVNIQALRPQQLDTLLDEYILFLALMKKTVENPQQPRSVFDAKSPPLVPSLAVQAVWFTHMLQSEDYLTLAYPHRNVYYTNEWPYHHPVTLPLTDEARANLEAETRTRWQTHYECDFLKYPIASTETDQNAKEESIASKLTSSPEFVEMKKKVQGHLQPAMIANDQDWLREFECFTQGTDVLDQAFLKKAHLGYQKMLHLKWKNEVKSILDPNLEAMRFAPCPAIDLMWHSHLLMPFAYYHDMERLLGVCPRHKLLPLEERTLVFLGQRETEEEQMWINEYGESLFEYSSLQSLSV